MSVIIVLYMMTQNSHILSSAVQILLNVRCVCLCMCEYVFVRVCIRYNKHALEGRPHTGDTYTPKHTYSNYERNEVVFVITL